MQTTDNYFCPSIDKMLQLYKNMSEENSIMFTKLTILYEPATLLQNNAKALQKCRIHHKVYILLYFLLVIKNVLHYFGGFKRVIRCTILLTSFNVLLYTQWYCIESVMKSFIIPIRLQSTVHHFFLSYEKNLN